MVNPYVRPPQCHHAEERPSQPVAPNNPPREPPPETAAAPQEQEEPGEAVTNPRNITKSHTRVIRGAFAPSLALTPNRPH